MFCPFDITNKKQVIEFEEQDPYNPQNILKGFVNRRQGHLYGSLWITHVNNQQCEQIIYSTPKMHYPFDKNDEWKFPESDSIEIYEKLDGTNIFSYMYKDENDVLFLTYKTRLRPFLGSSKFGNFKLLWDEMLQKYPDINKLCRTELFGFSFELYGKRNKILVEYDVPLDTKLIFIRDQQTGQITSPHSCKDLLEQVTVPHLQYLTSLDIVNQEIYIQHQQELQNALDVDEDKQIIKGKEGTVWYFLQYSKCDEYPSVQQIKCKPEGILKYHWSPDSISYESIYTTVINAFENFNNPTFGDVVELLKEEFEIDKIEKSRTRIENMLERVTFEKKLQFEVVEKYNKLGIDINKNKGDVMRYFAKEYPKSQSRRIFTLLNSYVQEKKK